MSTAREQMGIATLNGQIYVIGGYSQFNAIKSFYKFVCRAQHDVQYLSSVERYCPSNNTWATLPSMIYNRASPGVAELHGKVYVLGGQSETGFRKSVEVFDPSTFTWSLVCFKNHIHCYIIVLFELNFCFYIDCIIVFSIYAHCCCCF